MPRLTPANIARAREIVSLYPQSRSALIPLCHLAQEQDGWLTPEAVGHIAELLDITPAQILGVATFYDLLHTEPVGRHLIGVCTNVACLLSGGEELLEHAERALGISVGGTSVDGEFTLEDVECIAFCEEAPCLQVNGRFFGKVDGAGFDRLVEDLRAGRLADTVPPHGTVSRVRREGGLRVSADRIAGERAEADAARAARKAAAESEGAR